MRIKHFKAVLLPILIIVSLLALMLAPTCGVGAQATENVIMRGESSAYNVDTMGDPPWMLYEKGDLPPIMAAKRCGNGAVVAAGISCSCRNGRWNDTNPPNPYPHLDDLFDAVFQWMVPGASSVLWYEGYSVYNDTVRCSDMVEALENLGYTVTGDSTEPITSDLLSGYNILVIPQFELGASATGGSPSLLPDADVEVIKSFVEGGGGLLIMDGADFGGYNYYKVHNKILKALDFDFGFQDDQIYDNDNPWGEPYELLAEVDDITEIGVDYKARTGGTTIGLYAVCSLASTKPNVKVQIVPRYQPSFPGATLEYTIVIVIPESPILEELRINVLTCDLAVEDDAGWGPMISENLFAVRVGENRTVTLSILIPENAEHCMKNNIRVTATAREYTGISDSATCVAHAITAMVPGVDVTISPSEITGSPGAVLRYIITVANTGTFDDNYSLAVSDNASWSLELRDNLLAVPAGENRTTTLRVVIPVAAENCTRDGITVSATSIENFEVSDDGGCIVHAFGVPPKRGVEVSISPVSKSGAPGKILTYYIEAKNVGESVDSYRLEVTGTKGWSSDLSVSSFWLSGAAGSSGRGILLNVEIPSDAAEGDLSTITVTVFGTGYENQVTCTAKVVAEAPWTLAVAAVVIIVVIIGVVLVIKRI